MRSYLFSELLLIINDLLVKSYIFRCIQLNKLVRVGRLISCICYVSLDFLLIYLLLFKIFSSASILWEHCSWDIKKLPLLRYLVRRRGAVWMAMELCFSIYKTFICSQMRIGIQFISSYLTVELQLSSTLSLSLNVNTLYAFQ